MDEQEQRRISLSFAQAPDFRSTFATGVWGGVAPFGLVSAAFFLDRRPVPEAVIHALEPDGTLGDELGRVPEPDGSHHIERLVQVEVVMLPATARAVAKWLVEKADEVERGSDTGEDGIEQDAER